MTTSNKAFKAAFQILEERWPGSVPFPELVEGVARMHPELAQEGPVNSLTKTLRSSMFEAFTKQFVELHSCPPRLMGVPGASPRSTALARHQAEVGPVVTNGWHRPVRLDSFSRLVLQHLDGSHDEERLIERLQGFIASGRISVSTDGRPVAEGPELDRALRGSLKDCLTRLASEALLIAG
jgi:methyltransferase-like protein